MEVKSSKAQSTPNEPHSPDPQSIRIHCWSTRNCLQRSNNRELPSGQRVSLLDGGVGKWTSLQGIVIPQPSVGHILGSRWVGKDGHLH
jgi:hypothetical protein